MLLSFEEEAGSVLIAANQPLQPLDFVVPSARAEMIRIMGW